MQACDGNHRVEVWKEHNIPVIQNLMVLPYDSEGKKMTITEFKILCQGTNWMQGNTDKICKFFLFKANF